MLQPSTIQLLRFPFSYFLMPVYWFALSFVQDINWPRAILIFVLLHVLLYPSSNGYNSYMDRDEGSIGGVANPMQPTRQLFYVTVWMDVAAFLLSFLITPSFAAAMLCYIICSRAYSNRYIRLKRFPVIGYLTVIVNQGALVFCMVYYGAAVNSAAQPIPWLPAIAAAFLIGGFYPITQVYQHEADAKDKVTTISMLLGKRGTFLFCAAMYAVAFGLLFVYFQQQRQVSRFMILQLFFIPVIIFFLRWLIQVWKDASRADFKRTMQMNVIAGTCTNLAFIVLLILDQVG
ncbi:UbiA family prenyltransferase [Chitinophaga agrisoli]|nr:UbiA family prenyltransferase [Chitinophaga agrisoli]